MKWAIFSFVFCALGFLVCGVLLISNLGERDGQVSQLRQELATQQLITANYEVALAVVLNYSNAKGDFPFYMDVAELRSCLSGHEAAKVRIVANNFVPNVGNPTIGYEGGTDISPAKVAAWDSTGKVVSEIVLTRVRH